MKPPLCDEFVACAGFFSIRFQLSRLSISLQESALIGRLFSKNLVGNSVGTSDRAPSLWLFFPKNPLRFRFDRPLYGFSAVFI